MAIGNPASPIIRSLSEIHSQCDCEVRVHFSNRWFERDLLKNALKVFRHFSMGYSPKRNGVLIYVNPKKRLYSIVVDQDFRDKTGDTYWNTLGKLFQQDLAETQIENAISITIRTIGETLKKYYMKESAPS